MNLPLVYVNILGSSWWRLVSQSALYCAKAEGRSGHREETEGGWVSLLIRVARFVGFQEHFKDSSIDFWRLTQIQSPHREHTLSNFITHSLTHSTLYILPIMTGLSLVGAS